MIFKKEVWPPNQLTFNLYFVTVKIVISRGVYTPIAIIVSPFGAFFSGEEKKKKKSGLSFSEEFTHPSLSLCRPLVFQR
jgi:hypothetical protein